MSKVSSSARRDATDEQLLLRYRDDRDAAAFEMLVNRYEKPLYNYLVRYLDSAPLAEEVFQATFLRLHEKCAMFQPGRRVRPWLYSIATHQAIDALRREGKHQAMSLDEPRRDADDEVGSLLSFLESTTPQPHQQAEQHEQSAWAHQAMDKLPHPQRQAILLVYFQGLKYREVAEILQVPLGTVKSRIHGALLALNKAWFRNHLAAN